MTYRLPIIYKDAKHQQIDPLVDQLDVSVIPVNPIAGNLIRIVTQGPAKGLFVGSASSMPVMYVSSLTGADAPNRGTKALPFQTVDYAIQTAIAQYGGIMPPLEGLNPPEFAVLPCNLTVVLKAGETHTLQKSYQFTSHVTFTYWGDAQYGDFDGPLVNGTTFGALMLDLNRPTLQCAIEAASANGITHFKALDNPLGNMPPTVTLTGVRVLLPSGAMAVSDYQDLLTVAPEKEGRLQLIGSIINKADATNGYGALGVHSRGRGILEEYASQMLVAGSQVTSGSSVDALNARKYFFKLYPDRLGNSSGSGTLTSGYTPTGMIQMMWTNVFAEPVLPGKTNLPTYPVSTDLSYGVGNYIFNLIRDPQARPLNVVTPALI